MESAGTGARASSPFGAPEYLRARAFNRNGQLGITDRGKGKAFGQPVAYLRVYRAATTLQPTRRIPHGCLYMYPASAPVHLLAVRIWLLPRLTEEKAEGGCEPALLRSHGCNQRLHIRSSYESRFPRPKRRHWADEPFAERFVSSKSDDDQ